MNSWALFARAAQINEVTPPSYGSLAHNDDHLCSSLPGHHHMDRNSKRLSFPISGRPVVERRKIFSIARHLGGWLMSSKLRSTGSIGLLNFQGSSLTKTGQKITDVKIMIQIILEMKVNFMF
jgi:hypothetical protein